MLIRGERGNIVQSDDVLEFELYAYGHQFKIKAILKNATQHMLSTELTELKDRSEALKQMDRIWDGLINGYRGIDLSKTP